MHSEMQFDMHCMPQKRRGHSIPLPAEGF